MEHVIAMDPGGRSGWASAIMKRDHFELTGGGVLRQDRMADWFSEEQGMYGMHGTKVIPKTPTWNVLVYESWRPRRENGSMDWIEGDPLLPAQHVGQIVWIARRTGMKIVEQHPSDKPAAIAAMPESILDLDRYSNEQHDKDARMHLWLYFWREWFTASVHPEDAVVAA